VESGVVSAFQPPDSSSNAAVKALVAAPNAGKLISG
jgi:hypothetical protein